MPYPPHSLIALVVGVFGTSELTGSSKYRSLIYSFFLLGFPILLAVGWELFMVQELSESEKRFNAGVDLQRQGLLQEVQCQFKDS